MNCRNCGALLQGEYCAQCGQRERGRDLRLRDLAGETFEEFSQLDGRLWRTLRYLVFRPGRVTADYLAGHRASYLPPLRLYLVVSFLVFLVASLGANDVNYSGVPEVDAEQVRQERGSGIYVPVRDEDGNRQLLSLSEWIDRQAGNDSPVFRWIRPALERLAANAVAIESDPNGFIEEVTQTIPQVMFVLLPLFALILHLAYSLSPFHFLQHLVFSIHYHTAGFIYYLLLYPVNWVLPGDYGGVVMAALWIYLPIALVKVYGSGVAGAVFKSLVIGLCYYFAVLVAGATHILITLATL